MRKFILLVILAALAAGYGLFSCRQPGPAPEQAITQTLLAQVDSFSAICTSIRTASTSQQLQHLFLEARAAYKKIEWATEYFEPTASRIVNGAPVQEVELSGQVFEPSGLQVIEGCLFPSYDSSRKKDILQQLDNIQGACRKYKTHFAGVDILDWQVFDATKLEVFRILTLGITGFDNPLTQKSMTESAAGLSSLAAVLAHYTRDTGNITTTFDAAIHYLVAHPDFNSFDRAEFITGYGNPLTAGITDLEGQLKIPITRYNRLLNQDARTLFDTNTFNSNAYVPAMAAFATPEKIALGKRLFADPSLSFTGTRSCQSCHQPEHAFTDGLVKNTILNDKGLLPRNTPTLINAALQPSQFYDLRVATLEEQAVAVVQNQSEMHGDMKLSVQRLWKDSGYRAAFATAFPKNNRTGIDTFEIMNAIGSYVRSLVALNSRFDEYMRGNRQAMNTSELNGFNLFMGKAKCATCHYMPLFNGNFPPRFIKIEAEVIGVPRTPAGHEIDPDPGRFSIIKVASFNHAFKTPTIRNATRTAPYMHNGVFTTLEEVMDFYNKGGGTGMGLKIDNQTLPFDKLELTDNERRDIIAFIKSLDSRS